MRVRISSSPAVAVARKILGECGAASSRARRRLPLRTPPVMRMMSLGIPLLFVDIENACEHFSGEGVGGGRRCLAAGEDDDRRGVAAQECEVVRGADDGDAV